MHRGYIKLWRKIESSEVWSRGAVHIGLFVYLLVRANWNEGWFEGHKIGRGQLATSMRRIEKDLKLTQKTVRNSVNNLARSGSIVVTKRANRFSIITICNFESYHDSQDCERQTKGKPRANQGRTGYHQSKKIRRLEGKNTTPIPILATEEGRHAGFGNGVVSAEFEQAWKAYPRKAGSKAKALAAYRSAKRDTGMTLDEVLDGISRYKAFVAATNATRTEDRRLDYQHGQTWFNGRGWQSEWDLPSESDQTSKGGVEW